MTNAREVERRLSSSYPGLAMPDFTGEPLSALIFCLLDQHERLEHSRPAYLRLRESCPDWNEVAKLGRKRLDEFLRQSRIVNHNQKSERLYEILKETSRRYRVADGTAPAEVRRQLDDLCASLTASELKTLYLGMVEHVRRRCKPSRPDCPACVLRDCCRYERVLLR